MILVLSLLTSIGWAAAEPTCVSDDPENCRITITAGDVAPFSGQLLSPRRAAYLAVMAGQCKERVRLEVEAAAAEASIDLMLEKRLRASDQEASNLRVKLLTESLERATEASQDGVWDHPVVWMIVGGIIVGAAIGTATAVISETRPTIVQTP